MAKRATKAGKAAAKPSVKPHAVKRAGRKPSTSSAAARGAADSVASAAVTQALSADRLDALPRDAVRLMAAVVRAYSAKVQAGEAFLPYDDRVGRVSPTDVMITASGLLKAADLQVFELGMWQKPYRALTCRPPTSPLQERA